MCACYFWTLLFRVLFYILKIAADTHSAIAFIKKLQPGGVSSEQEWDLKRQLEVQIGRQLKISRHDNQMGKANEQSRRGQSFTSWWVSEAGRSEL